jgi:hypothetical protein
LDLGTIISAAVCVRIGVQFIGQIIGLHCCNHATTLSCRFECGFTAPQPHRSQEAGCTAATADRLAARQRTC